MPKVYPITMIGLVSHYILLNFVPVFFSFPVKKRVYTEEHMKKFEDEHKKAFGDDTTVEKFGLPDQGTGWYSRDLSFKDQIDI